MSLKTTRTLLFNLFIISNLFSCLFAMNPNFDGEFFDNGLTTYISLTLSQNIVTSELASIEVDNIEIDGKGSFSITLDKNNALNQLKCKTLSIRNCDLLINDSHAFNVGTFPKTLVLENVTICLSCDLVIPETDLTIHVYEKFAVYNDRIFPHRFNDWQSFHNHDRYPNFYRPLYTIIYNRKSICLKPDSCFECVGVGITFTADKPE